MKWSLSEFLNLIQLHGQNWWFIEMDATSGFRPTPNEAMFLYAVLEGTARIATKGGCGVKLEPGDVAILASGDPHMILSPQGDGTQLINISTLGEPNDSPPTIRVGQDHLENRLLCGRLEVVWPAGFQPRDLPAMFLVNGPKVGVDLGTFAAASGGQAASSLLTRLAKLLFVTAFREHPFCDALFKLNLDDPISRAQQLIQMHPFQPWTVEALANKVGMGRSNFAARFTAQVGQAPMDALAKERMTHAASFLRHTDLKVAEIGERVGYRSKAAFIRRFTTHFGKTPGKLRRQER